MTGNLPLETLMSQRAAVDAQIAQHRPAALAEIRALITTYGIQPAELFDTPRRSVAPKYRNPESGATWSGRGKPPNWIKGRDYCAFAIGGAR